MASELKFAVLFTAVDQFSSTMGRIGNSLTDLVDRVTGGSEAVTGIGSRMAE